MGTVNIATFFQERYSAFQASLQEVRKKNEGVVAQLNEVGKSIQSIEKEINARETLKKQAAENGLDTAPLDKQLKQSGNELEALRIRQQTLQAETNRPDPEPSFNWRVVDPAAEVLAKNGCPEAELVEKVGEAFEHIEVRAEDLSVDDAGRPIDVRVRWDGHEVAKVKIVPGEKCYAKSFRPKALSWLPSLAGEPVATPNGGHINPTTRAVIVAEHCWLILPKQVTIVHEYRKSQWGSQEPPRVETLSDPAIVLMSSLATEALEEAGGELELEQTYPTNAFMSCLRRKVLEHTTEECRWQLVGEGASDSEKTYSLIKEDWLLLHSAPWSWEVDEVWAKLKYTVENGEKPRFWCNDHVGHYAYRVRTRDHTWIIGRLFIDKTQPAGSKGTPLKSVKGADSHVRRIGRMYMTAGEYK